MRERWFCKVECTLQVDSLFFLENEACCQTEASKTQEKKKEEGRIRETGNGTTRKQKQRIDNAFL